MDHRDLLHPESRSGSEHKFPGADANRGSCVRAEKLPALRPDPPVRAPLRPPGAGSRGGRQWRRLNDPDLDQSPGYAPRPILTPEPVRATHIDEKYFPYFQIPGGACFDAHTNKPVV